MSSFSTASSEDTPPNTLLDPAKRLWQRSWANLSIKGQQQRIGHAEDLYQAAVRQAEDP